MRVLARARGEVILAVDPSVRFCGVAVFRDGRLVTSDLLSPRNARREEDEYLRAADVYRQVRSVYDLYTCTRMVLEVPAHWATEGFVARESGNLQKLIFLCGMLSTIATRTTLVQPHEWKGQMKKKVMRNRFLEDYGHFYRGVDLAKVNHNVMDAIGLGHFYLYGKV